MWESQFYLYIKGKKKKNKQWTHYSVLKLIFAFKMFII